MTARAQIGSPGRVKARLLEALEARRGELVELCARTVRIPSQNPPGDTTAIARFVREYLEALGLAVREYAPKPDRPNLVASLGEARPHLVLNAHLDEFPATGDGWSHPPFAGVVEEGRLYGRGASDMRAGLAVSLFLARLLVDLRLRLPGRLTPATPRTRSPGGHGGPGGSWSTPRSCAATPA